MRCVLVSCCGLPAAGKTTFCRSIAADASTTTSAASATDTCLPGDSVTKDAPRARVSHVCFDEHIDRARVRCEPCRSIDNKPPTSYYPHANAIRPPHDGNIRGRMQQETGGEDEEVSEKDMSRNGVRESIDERDSSDWLRTLSPVGKNRNTEVIDTIQGLTAGNGDGCSTRTIETLRTTESARATPDYDGDMKGGERGARWWHEGRRAAMAEIEALASAPQVRGGSPRTTSSGNECPMRRRGAPSSAKAAMVSTVAAADVEAGERVVDADEVAMHPMGVSVGPEEGLPRTEASSAIHVVLADDNMHFRSMRQEIWRLARQLGCGYAQVYFPTDVNVAVKRNEMRGRPVTEAVIRKMAASIQPPDPERFKWERHTTVVEPPERTTPRLHATRLTRCNGENSNKFPSRSSSGFRTPCPAEEDLDTRDGAAENARGIKSRRSFWRAVAAAAAEDRTPLPSPAPSTATLLEQEADRLATRASLLHQFDLELRETVKRVAKATADAGVTRDVHQKVMGACTTARKIAIRDSSSGGGQSRAETSNQDTATRIAISTDRDGDIRSVQKDTEIDCTIANVVGARRTPFSSLPRLERFLSEFEKALCVVGLDLSLVDNLVAVARSPGRTMLHQL